MPRRAQLRQEGAEGKGSEREKRKIVRNLILLAIVLLAAPLALVGCAYVRSPPSALNLIDGLYPRAGDVQRVGDGIAFTPAGTRLDIWADVADTGEGKPVLVFFYGGGWMKGERTSYDFVGRTFAERGFVAVIADYRLVPQVKFPAFVEDAAAALAWTQTNIAPYGGDPDRVVLAGHSAGAHIAMLLGLDPSWTLAAGGDPAGVRAVLGMSGPYDFHPFTSERAIAAMGDAPDPLQTQPIDFARVDAPPLWLATGTADTVVKPRNSRALAARQAELGSTTTQLREYDGLSHNDIIMAVSEPFRGRGPIVDDSIAFLRAQSVIAE